MSRFPSRSICQSCSSCLMAEADAGLVRLLPFRKRLNVPLAMLVNIVDHPGLAFFTRTATHLRFRTDIFPSPSPDLALLRLCSVQSACQDASQKWNPFSVRSIATDYEKLSRAPSLCYSSP